MKVTGKSSQEVELYVRDITDEEKSFIVLTSVVSDIKLFYSVT